MSAASLLSSRRAPLAGGRGRAATSTTTTTTTLSPTLVAATNASFDSASFAPSASNSTTRVLANGTGLWLDRSALAYDILVGQVREGESKEMISSAPPKRRNRASEKKKRKQQGIRVFELSWISFLVFSALDFCIKDEKRSKGFCILKSRAGEVEDGELEAKPQRRR